MKRPSWGEIVAVVGIVLILAAILFPVFEQSKGGGRDRCLSNLKMQANAMMMYAGDSDDRLPPRDAWMDATDSYLRNESARHCPQALPKGAYGYAFNGALDRKSRLKVEDVATMPMLYDSLNPIRNASDLVTSLPSLGRHRGHNRMAYADGHAKSVVVQ